MAKFQIEYELKANIGTFKKETANVVKDASKIGAALDKSVSGIDQAIKGKGLSKYFSESKKVAEELKKTVKELNDELNKGGAKADPNKLKALQQSVQAGKLQYAAEVAAASQASRGETPVEANLIRARYALYDLANEARRVGTVMTGLSLATIKVGADFQRSFADVERTTGLIGPELEALRDSLVSISTATSVSFKDVANLATLAAQMGIEGANVAEFSETVAKFSMVTGVTVQNAAQSFGRIAELLNVTSDEYDNLASSILFAGRNSVATEAEILSVTTQIAASAEAAGFLASEAVGLGTALASLRIQPEQARGVILRLFADFDRAMAKNGKDLEDYASILGMSTEATKELYNAGGPEFFVQLTKALGDAQAAGTDMNVVLNQIGITNTREVNVLQRLVGNHDLLVKSLEDATGAYTENTDLQSQYAIVAETLTEQLGRLKNNIDAISAAASAPGVEILGTLLAGVNEVLSAISKNQVASFLVGLTSVVGLGAGVFLLYKAAILQATATLFAMRTSMQELGLTAIGTSVSIKGLVAQIIQMKTGADVSSLSLRGMAASMGTASAGASALNFAMKALPFIALTSLLWIAVDGVINFKDATARAKEGLEELKQEILNTADLASSDLFKDRNSLFEKVFQFDGPKIQRDIDGITQSVTAFQEALIILQRGQGQDDLGKALTANFYESEAQIKLLNAAFEDLVSSGNYQKANDLMAVISDQASKIGISTQELNLIFPQYQENLTKVAAGLEQIAATDAATELREVAAAIKEDLTGAFITPQKDMSSFTVATLEFLQALKDSRNGIDVFTEDGRNAFKGFEGIINAIIEKAGTDLTQALMASAAAIQMVEQAGGNASSQLVGLVELLNEKYSINLDPSAFSTLAALQAEILKTGGISAVTRAEISRLLGGGDFTKVFSNIFAGLQSQIRSTGTVAKEEVITIFDYIGQLRGLFNNITDLAFANEVATDNAAEGWDSVARSADSARASIANIKKELSDLRTERGSLESQLDIAKRFGDVKEIARLQAEIAAVDARMASGTEELSYQQGRASLTLRGNTRAARENRTEIRARVEESKALITAYAQTAKANGQLPTPAEVAAYAQTVANGFAEQATEIGFSADELTDYTTIISGFGTAVSAVTPPNVDVTINPITTAVETYLKKKKNTDVTVKPKVSGAAINAAIAELQRLYGVQAPPRRMIIDPSDVRLYRMAFERGHLTAAQYHRAVYGESLTATVTGGGGTGSMLMQADGGYISGPGTSRSDSIPAMLSNGEYVIQAAAVNRYGVGFFDSLNQMKSGSAGPAAAPQIMATSSSSVVYLSDMDRDLLRGAIDRPVALYTSDKKIAESANAGNVELARRGSR